MADATSPTIQLLLAGDTMLGRKVNEVIGERGSAFPLEALAPLTTSADLFFVNLECAITPKDLLYLGPPKAFYFRADPVAAETLCFAGVNLVTLANNHALDADFEGLVDTIRILDQKDIAYVGVGRNLGEADEAVIVESKGQRIGVLAYCDHQPDFEVGIGRPGIRYVDLRLSNIEELIAFEVEDLAKRVDHVVVAFHWQPNWVPHVHPFYRALARQMIEAGARVIWGHSPHHFQGVEWIGNSVVLYSTGGLVDDYALNLEFRNDRELLFQVMLTHSRVEQVRAYPIELKYAHSIPASPQVWQWIAQRFAEMCSEVESDVKQQGRWLEIIPR